MRRRRIGLVEHRGVEPTQHVDGIARMRVGEDDSVDGRESGEFVGALHELAGGLAEGGAVLGDGLVEARSGPAAAVPEQQHLGDAGLPAQELHAGLNVERRDLRSAPASRCS